MKKLIKKTRNEKTSARVAKIAARVLAMPAHPYGFSGKNYVRLGDNSVLHKGFWHDIRALAASALTQTKDKPKVDAATVVWGWREAKKVKARGPQKTRPFREFIEELRGRATTPVTFPKLKTADKPKRKSARRRKA